MKNYYNLLGIKSSASFDQIKYAYLEKMKKYHPDIFAGDKNFAMQKTQELNLAYNTLKDAEKRKEYDEALNCNNNKNILVKMLNKIKIILKKIGNFFCNIFKKISNLFKLNKNCNSSQIKGHDKLINTKLKIVVIIQTIIIFILLLIIIF